RAVRAGGGEGAAPARERVRRGSTAFWLLAATLFLVVALLVGVLVGPVNLGVVNVVRGTFAHVFGLHSPLSGSDDAILWELRLPRVILAALVGGTLAAAGAAAQVVFRNPLADPYLLGAAAGAGLGATVVVAYAPAGSITGDLLPVAAFVGAAVAVVLAYVLGRSAGVAVGPAALVLAGVTITSFLTALQTFVQQQHVDTVQEIYSWLLGRLATSGWREVGIVLPYIAVSWIVILAHRRLLDVLSV